MYRVKDIAHIFRNATGTLYVYRNGDSVALSNGEFLWIVRMADVPNKFQDYCKLSDGELKQWQAKEEVSTRESTKRGFKEYLKSNANGLLPLTVTSELHLDPDARCRLTRVLTTEGGMRGHLAEQYFQDARTLFGSYITFKTEGANKPVHVYKEEEYVGCVMPVAKEEK